MTPRLSAVLPFNPFLRDAGRIAFHLVTVRLNLPDLSAGSPLWRRNFSQIVNVRREIRESGANHGDSWANATIRVKMSHSILTTFGQIGLQLHKSYAKALKP